MNRDFPEINELLGATADILPASPDAGATPVDVAASVGVSGLGGGAYDGANRFDQLAMWQPSIRSADAEIIPEKLTLDARARDTLRNDAYVAGGATLHKDNIVGARFLLNAKPETKVLWGREDETWEKEFQEEVESKFTLWAESPSKWIDAARINTLTEMVRLAVGVYVAGGEVVAAAEWMPADGRPFRTAMQMIDADRLSTPPNRVSDPRIVGGVEKDARGAPVAYHFQKAHPSDWQQLDNYIWKRVPARKPWGRQMVLHVYEQMRPDQTRGVSSMVAALMEMRMTKSFRKVELQRAVVAATYAASIESDLPPAEVFASMGGSQTDNPSLDWIGDYLEAVNAYSGGAKNLSLDGAKIPVFMPGTHLKIQSPGSNGPLGDQFEQSLLRHIASALGVSYEQLSRDYTKTNYSSARAAMGETWKTMLSRKKIVADTTASFVYRLWLEEAINSRALETLKRRNVPLFYEGLNSEAYSSCEWIGAGRGLIDPLKETQADVLALKHGLDTKESVIAKRTGSDWRKTVRQIARERAMDKEYDLPSVFDMKSKDQENALSGTPQERES